jgi:hypothetical protein
MIGNLNSPHRIQHFGRGFMRLTVGTALAVTLAACGGGGGGSGDGDLRAAYDRINRACMTHSDVEQAVGSAATSAPNDGNRIWTSGNQRLQVQFTQLDSGTVAGAVTWDLIPGQQLTKGFRIEGCE